MAWIPRLCQWDSFAQLPKSFDRRLLMLFLTPGEVAAVTTPNVLMIFPRFNPNSFWSLQAACDIHGVRCPAPPLGLITLAALLPCNWNIRLVNRNAEALDPADLAWADMVMTGGMLPQRVDSLEIIRMAQAQGKPVVVGGPDVMSSPEAFEHADFLVVGEADVAAALVAQALPSGHYVKTPADEQCPAGVWMLVALNRRLGRDLRPGRRATCRPRL